MPADHIYEVCQRWTNVYARPSAFSAATRRLGRGQRLVGQPVDNAWMQCAGVGYVRQAALRDLREYDVDQEQMTAAVERFHAAVTQQSRRAELQAATRDLLEALAATAQQLVTQAVAILMERQDEQARRLDILQREIAALNVRIDERQHGP